MRSKVLSLVFVGLVALAAPAAARPDSPDTAEAAAAPAPVAFQRVALPFTRMRDEAAMVLVGTALIGLAAAVRRAA
jgi:hypothetical protein